MQGADEPESKKDVGLSRAGGANLGLLGHDFGHPNIIGKLLDRQIQRCSFDLLSRLKTQLGLVVASPGQNSVVCIVPLEKFLSDLWHRKGFGNGSVALTKVLWKKFTTRYMQCSTEQGHGKLDCTSLGSGSVNPGSSSIDTS